MPQIGPFDPATTTARERNRERRNEQSERSCQEKLEGAMKKLWIPQLIVCAMLLWALSPSNPYGYTTHFFAGSVAESLHISHSKHSRSTNRAGCGCLVLRRECTAHSPGSSHPRYLVNRESGNGRNCAGVGICFEGARWTRALAQGRALVAARQHLLADFFLSKEAMRARVGGLDTPQ
jgi:hypothetical protein